ncbi:hypothetical protein B0H16DRAFT_1698132 [Mycena metata]|uniref:Uncharacterized protein n=1 Tax=Mycena metata TaxID=1033252 RepID=A0AAD7HQR1_9AGAR|nr:hypothetical protein B0H16DRAFT_1698132 [Mycena metata]
MSLPTRVARPCRSPRLRLSLLRLLLCRFLLCIPYLCSAPSVTFNLWPSQTLPHAAYPLRFLAVSDFSLPLERCRSREGLLGWKDNLNGFAPSSLLVPKPSLHLSPSPCFSLNLRSMTLHRPCARDDTELREEFNTFRPSRAAVAVGYASRPATDHSLPSRNVPVPPHSALLSLTVDDMRRMPMPPRETAPTTREI